MNRHQGIALFVFGIVVFPLLLWAATTTQFIHGNLDVSATLRAPTVRATTSLLAESATVYGAVNNTTGTVRSANVRATTLLQAEAANVFGAINNTTGTVRSAVVRATTNLMAEAATVYGAISSTTTTAKFSTIANPTGTLTITSGFSIFPQDLARTRGVMSTWGTNHNNIKFGVVDSAGSSIFDFQNRLGNSQFLIDLNANLISAYTNITGSTKALSMARIASTGTYINAFTGPISAANMIISGTTLHQGVVTTTGSDVFGDAAGDTTTITGLLQGGPVNFSFAFTTTGYATWQGQASSATVGWIAPGNGSILTFTGNSTNVTGAFEVRKNGTNVFSGDPGSSPFSYPQAKGTDTFVVGDVISLYVNPDGVGTATIFVTIDTYAAIGN